MSGPVYDLPATALTAGGPSLSGESDLYSVLILGSDAVAAASPATSVQLVHACHRWGFSTVVPASWGDELLASEVIRRCSSRENRPVIQCSCPRVAERLGNHAARLDDSIFWLATPPVAAAEYLRAHSAGAEMHITYAGSCPGARDSSIDQRMSPTELLLAISSRGIDVSAQPMVFENIIPPDRRRHLSIPAGAPDPQRLWEAAAFRVAQPTDIDLSIGVAQLLLADERILIDIAPQVGCVCRLASGNDGDAPTVLRSPSPIVRDGVVDVSRAAPVTRDGAPSVSAASAGGSPSHEAERDLDRGAFIQKRQTPGKGAFRRQVSWRRQTPRPGVVVARVSATMVAVPESMALFRRPAVGFAIVTFVAVASLMLGMWIASPG